MRLYLSSYRLGLSPQAMLRSLRSNAVAVIQNAQDCWTDPVKRQSVLEREYSDLRELGLEPTALDLRKFFGQRAALEREIERFSYCWVCGGNSFVLRRAFHLSGFDAILREFASHDDSLVYGGYSAGACVMTPTLEGIHLADEPASCPDGYSGDAIWEGVALYPHCIAPHYRSDHYETHLIEKSVEYFIENKIPFIALHDGEAVTFDTVTKRGECVRLPRPGSPGV